MSIKITKAHILWFNNSNSRNLSFNYSHTCVQSHTEKLFVVMLIMAKVEKQISILIHTHSLTHFSNIYYLVTSYQVLWPMIFTYLLIYTFSQQEYWSGLSCLLPTDSGIEPMSPASPASAGGFFTAEPRGKPIYTYTYVFLKVLFGCLHFIFI